jgi:hypothetical protein
VSAIYSFAATGLGAFVALSALITNALAFGFLRACATRLGMSQTLMKDAESGWIMCQK